MFEVFERGYVSEHTNTLVENDKQIMASGVGASFAGVGREKREGKERREEGRPVCVCLFMNTRARTKWVT